MARKAEFVTQRMVNALHAQMSYPAMARYLCLELRFVPTLSRIANGGPVSVTAENEVRHRLGLAPIMPPTIPVPTCPDCGSVHHARCNGNGGTAIVLAPGETVRRPGQPRTRRQYWRPCLPATLTPQQREAVIEFAATLAGPVPGLEGGA